MEIDKYFLSFFLLTYFLNAKGSVKKFVPKSIYYNTKKYISPPILYPTNDGKMRLNV